MASRTWRRRRGTRWCCATPTRRSRRRPRTCRSRSSEHMAGVILAAASDRTNLDDLLATGRPVVAVDRGTGLRHRRRGHGEPHRRSGGDREPRAGGLPAYRLRHRTAAHRDIAASVRRAGGSVVERHFPDLDADELLRYSTFRVDGGREAMEELLALPEPPDAVVAGNNLLGVGAIQVLTERGLTPPTFGVAVVGSLPFTTLSPIGRHRRAAPRATHGGHGGQDAARAHRRRRPARAHRGAAQRGRAGGVLVAAADRSPYLITPPQPRPTVDREIDFAYARATGQIHDVAIKEDAMTTRCTLGVDIGTSSSKGVLVDVSRRDPGRRRGRRTTSTVRAPGWVEMDAAALVGRVRRPRARSCSPPPATVDRRRGRRGRRERHGARASCSRTRPTSPVRPAILYGVDTRSRRADRTGSRDELGAEEITRVGGSPLTTQAGRAEDRVDRRRGARCVRRARAACFMPASWLVRRLTGAYVLDHQSASQVSPLYDIDAAALARAVVGPTRAGNRAPGARLGRRRRRARSRPRRRRCHRHPRRHPGHRRHDRRLDRGGQRRRARAGRPDADVRHDDVPHRDRRRTPCAHRRCGRPPARSPARATSRAGCRPPVRSPRG